MHESQHLEARPEGRAMSLIVGNLRRLGAKLVNGSGRALSRIQALPAAWRFRDRLIVRPLPADARIPEGQRITVLSVNLWHDWPRHRRLPARLEALAQLIEREGADIILLQEVMRTPKFASDVWLADRLGMAYAYARANGHESAIGFEEGEAVFSRFPLIEARHWTLPPTTGPFSRRVALGAQLQLPCCRLWAFSTHLSMLSGQNAQQLNHLRAWVNDLGGEGGSLIGGDFNAQEATARMRTMGTTWVDTFRSLHPERKGATHSLRWPWGGQFRHKRLDYLFLRTDVRAWQVTEARHLAWEGLPASDHQPVLTRLIPGS